MVRLGRRSYRITLAVYSHSKGSLVVLHLCDVMLISHILYHTNDTKGVIGELGVGRAFSFFLFLKRKAFEPLKQDATQLSVELPASEPMTLKSL